MTRTGWRRRMVAGFAGIRRRSQCRYIMVARPKEFARRLARTSLKSDDCTCHASRPSRSHSASRAKTRPSITSSPRRSARAIDDGIANAIGHRQGYARDASRCAAPRWSSALSTQRSGQGQVGWLVHRAAWRDQQQSQARIRRLPGRRRCQGHVSGSGAQAPASSALNVKKEKPQ